MVIFSHKVHFLLLTTFYNLLYILSATNWSGRKNLTITDFQILVYGRMKQAEVAGEIMNCNIIKKGIVTMPGSKMEAS